MNCKSFIYPTFTNYLMETYNLTIEISSLFFMINAVTYFLLIQFIPRMTEILGTKLTILLGSFINSISILFFPPIAILPHRVEIIILGLVIFGVPTACIDIPGVFDIIHTLRGRGYDEDFANTIASGVYTLAYAFGEVVGPTFGGFITERYNFATSCICTSIINFIYGVIFCLFTYKVIISYFNSHKKEVLLEKIEMIRDRIQKENF
jgi:MFS family permease